MVSRMSYGISRRLCGFHLGFSLAVPKAVAVFPERGGDAIRAVMRAAVLTFDAVASTQLRGPVCIFARALAFEGLNQGPVPPFLRIQELSN